MSSLFQRLRLLPLEIGKYQTEMMSSFYAAFDQLDSSRLKDESYLEFLEEIAPLFHVKLSQESTDILYDSSFNVYLKKYKLIWTYAKFIRIKGFLS
jgi:uncharacterized protein (UPF0305 family)